MYYKDLSKYEYRSDKSNIELLNVGWLDKNHPFSTGTTTGEFKIKLFNICKNLVNQTRGFHYCDFCDRHPEHGAIEEILDNDSIYLGSAEIRVLHKDGTVFASPNMIYHYIVKHNYLPPEKFIEAVLNGTTIKKKQWWKFWQ